MADNQKIENPFTLWKLVHCKEVSDGMFTLIGETTIGPFTNKQLFEMYNSGKVKSYVLADEDALHIGRELLSWGHLHDSSVIHQVKIVLCTMAYYRQSNISADRWKMVFDYLDGRGYNLPFETVSEEDLLKELHKKKDA